MRAIVESIPKVRGRRRAMPMEPVIPGKGAGKDSPDHPEEGPEQGGRLEGDGYPGGKPFEHQRSPRSPGGRGDH